MKKQITKTLVGLVMLFVLVASASAQTARPIKVQIPFDFVAGQTQLPAGRYIVRNILRDSESAIIFESENGRSKAIVHTNAGGGAPERAQVVFRKHGEQFFLAEVSLPGTWSVRVAPESRAEKKLKRELRERAKASEAEEKSVTVIGNVQ